MRSGFGRFVKILDTRRALRTCAASRRPLQCYSAARQRGSPEIEDHHLGSGLGKCRSVAETLPAGAAGDRDRDAGEVVANGP